MTLTDNNAEEVFITGEMGVKISGPTRLTGYEVGLLKNMTEIAP